MTKRKTFIVLLVILQIFIQLLSVECLAEAKKGSGKAFGAGVLAGGLAGAAVGHLMTRQNNPTEIHHIHHIAAAPNTAVNVATANPSPVLPQPTVVERGETLPNGCYEQTVQEPNVNGDATSFIKTKMLICPPPAPYIQQIPSEPVAPVTHAYPLPLIPLPVPTQHVAPENNVPSHQASLPTASPVTQPPTHSETQQSHPVAPVVPVVQQHLPQPSQPAISAPPSYTGQVFVLSKTTGFYEHDKMKKNSAGNQLAINFGIILFIAGLLNYV